MLGKFLLLLALVVPSIGLAASLYQSVTRTTEGLTAGEQSALTDAAFPRPAPDVGSQVGDRAPDFTLELADGSAVTSASLSAAGQPTFLFFWATT